VNGESLEAIQADFLRGQEIMLNAFNRLLAMKAPVIPVATQVRVERIREE
jgi:hypothetical protein